MNIRLFLFYFVNIVVNNFYIWIVEYFIRNIKLMIYICCDGLNDSFLYLLNELNFNEVKFKKNICYELW